MKLLITTNPGMEDLLIKELVSLLNLRTDRLCAHVLNRGRILINLLVNMSINDIFLLAARSNLAHKISMVLAEGNVSKDMRSLDIAYELTLKSCAENYLNQHLTFAVRAERIGEHEYTSIDLAKYVGQAIVDAVMEKYGIRPPVNLDHPTVIFDALVVGSKFFLALRISGEESLHKRGYRIYDHPAALKPTIAYGMLQIADLKDGEVLLDPMCGGGTVVIEAARNFKLKNIYCMDISPKHLKGAMKNAIASSTYDSIVFILGDARKANEYVKDRVDAIVTNPPYGIRMLRRKYLRKLYSDFLKSAKNILSNKGRIVIITAERSLFKEEALKAGYNILSIRKVLHGNLEVEIIKIEPT